MVQHNMQMPWAEAEAQAALEDAELQSLSRARTY